MENRFSYQNEISRETRQKVVNATKKSYFNYLIAQEIVKVQKTQLENAEQTLLDIEKRKESIFFSFISTVPFNQLSNFY